MSGPSSTAPVRRCLLATLVFLSLLPTTRAQQQSPTIAIGTILPVRLNEEINSRKAQSGQIITAKIMQDVPLPAGHKIPKGAVVSGIIVSSAPGSHGQATVRFRLDTVELKRQKATITTNLRALASPLEVRMSQVPETSPGFGTSWAWVTTRQVGGDEVYGRYGVVTDRMSERVGTSVADGVLVEVRAEPGSECRGKIADENPVQALWVFSSDACGVYGSETLLIRRAGGTDPKGQIELVSSKNEVKVRAGSGMLLRVER